MNTMRAPSKRPATLRRVLGPMFGLLLLAAAQPIPAGEPSTATRLPVLGAASGLEAAITLAGRRVEAEPSSAEARVDLGNLLLEKGALQAAEKAFGEALALNPRSHEAIAGKGIVLSRLGQDQAAEEMLRQALLLNPNPVRAHYELGLLYQRRGELDRAISEYKLGLEKFRQGRR